MLTETKGDGRRGAKPEPIGIGYRLPDAAVQQLSGLIDTLSDAPYRGRADLPHVADQENLVMDELFPLIEALQLLGFAQISDGDIELTALGPRLCRRGHAGAQAAFRRCPDKARAARGAYPARPRRAAGPPRAAARFLRELEDHLSEDEAERVLDTVINWGRHAEIFAYDYDSEVLTLWRISEGPQRSPN